MSLSLRTLLVSIAVINFTTSIVRADGKKKPPNPKKYTLKAATKVPSSINPRIAINRPFFEGMAESANLDPKAPLLSSDGIHSGNLPNQQKVASAECLLGETVVEE